MKLYFYGFILLIKKFILRKNTGKCVFWFAKKMGVVYIKFAQMLAMQNIGNLFTEEDRKELSLICDQCNPISFKKIKKSIEKEYGCLLEDKFKDVKQIRKFVHRFGKFIHFKNYLGSDAALELYLSWIREEVDFRHEKNNILRYYHFASSVNGHIPNTVNIVVPKVYKKMCTDNIIVMEFIYSKTINKMQLTYENKEKIRNSLNDYISLSFYALLHNMPVVFHGDPHGGNIYIEKNGNIGFLDMGLIFEFSKEEVQYVQKLFLYAYTCDVEKLYLLLSQSSYQKDVDEETLKNEIRECCKQFKTVPVSSFFVNMIMVYVGHNIEPAPILYKMAKAFVALFGMGTFLDNVQSTEELLYEQIVEFYIHRSVEDFKELTYDGVSVLPQFIKNTFEKGLTKSVSESIVTLSGISKKMTKAANHLEEVVNFFK